MEKLGYAYEALFDVQAITELERSMAPWRAERSDIRVGKLGYRTKTTKAGPMLEFDIYPIYGRQQDRQARKALGQATPERMRQVNLYNARRRVIQLANANFGPRDIHLTLTYAQAPDYSQAQKDVRNFLARVRRIRRKVGLPELKYIYAIEDNQNGKKARLHVHMLMNGGVAREQLEQLWAKGYANADRLQPDENGLAAIARYIIKQGEREGGSRRKWCASKNLKKPKVRVSDTKLSNSRVKKLARQLPMEAQEVLGKVYPGYAYVACEVYFSDRMDGVYIRGTMRRVSGMERAVEKGRGKNG
ncbi:MAG: hypothetical protein ACI4MJ_01150 [Aristaeellaceae bacterium]